MNHPSTFTIGEQQSELLRRLPQQLRAQKTVDAFFKAAARVLEEHGEAGFSTNKVAGQAALSVGTLYRYFPNKQQLLWAMALKGQALVLAKLDAHLAPLEADAQISHQESKQILRGVIEVFVEALACGKSTPSSAGFGRTLIRLAWTWENPGDTAAMANQVANRLLAFFRNIHHPSLPPPNSAQMFVMVRGVMGVLRYESLTQSLRLDTDILVDRLVEFSWSMFVEGPEQTPDEKKCRSAQSNSTYLETLARASAHNADRVAILDAEDREGLRRKPTQKRAEETVGTIFTALVQVLDAVGDDGLTTNKVAKRSGFSIGTLYQYFPDKKKLVWAASVFGAKVLYGKMDEYFSAIEAAPALAKSQDHREYIRYVIHMYVDVLSNGKGLFNSHIFNQPLLRLTWRWENPRETYLMVEQTSTRIGAFWGCIDHPAYPKVIDHHRLMVMNLGFISILRSAILERSPLLGSTALREAMLQMTMVMNTGKP